MNMNKEFEQWKELHKKLEALKDTFIEVAEQRVPSIIDYQNLYQEAGYGDRQMTYEDPYIKITKNEVVYEFSNFDEDEFTYFHIDLVDFIDDEKFQAVIEKRKAPLEERAAELRANRKKLEEKERAKKFELYQELKNEFESETNQ